MRTETQRPGSRDSTSPRLVTPLSATHAEIDELILRNAVAWPYTVPVHSACKRGLELVVLEPGTERMWLPDKLMRAPLVVIVDDRDGAGPDGFAGAPLMWCLVHSVYVAIVPPTDPPVFVYRYAANTALEHKKPTVIIETTPAHVERWARRVERDADRWPDVHEPTGGELRRVVQ